MGSFVFQFPEPSNSDHIMPLDSPLEDLDPRNRDEKVIKNSHEKGIESDQASAMERKPREEHHLNEGKGANNAYPHKNESTKTEPPQSRLERYQSLIEQKRWKEALTYFSNHFESQLKLIRPPLSIQSQTNLKSWNAIALSNYIHAGNTEWSPQEQVERLEAQIIRTPEVDALFSTLSILQYTQGSIQKALSTLSHGAAQMQDLDTANRLLNMRDDFVFQHIEFLKKNEHWRELIHFVRSEPTPSSPHYYKLQLAAAKAHAQLYEWEDATSLLNMVDFDPELHAHSNQLRKIIAKTKNDLKEQSLRIKTKNSEHRKNKDEKGEYSKDEHSNDELSKDEILIPFETWGNSIIVPISIGSHKISLLLDTGASLTMLSTAWIQKTSQHHLTRLPSRVFITAGGRIQSPMIRMENVRLGPFEFQHVDMAFQDIFSPDQPVHGLLGMNILKHFELNIDFSSSQLKLRPKKH
jgi:predicted aspartyl protease